MSKKISFRAKDVAGPPEHSAWIWHTSELLRSPAWRGASLNLRRLLDFLEIEHLKHSRRDNGALMALYDDLEKLAGIGRRLILQSIKEGEKRGLIEVEHGVCWAGGKRQPSRFRITYLPTCAVDSKTKVTTWYAPTDDWRQYGVQPKKATRPKSILPMSKGEPVPVHEGELVRNPDSTVSARNQVHEGEPVTSAPSCTTYTDSREGGAPGTGPAVVIDGESGGTVVPARCGALVVNGIGPRVCGRPVGTDGERCAEHAAGTGTVARASAFQPSSRRYRQ
jgi:hypothetical protein